MRHLFPRILAAAAVTVMALGMSVQPAHAAVSWSYTRASGQWIQSAGTAKYDNVLDRFYLYDNRADGAGVYAEVTLNRQGSQTNYFYWGGGGGTSSSWAANYPSGFSIEYRVCLQDNGQVQAGTCSFLTRFNT
ncbi:hypothetical protein AB0G04_36085 [Actinoplanes sp. NPDC023801]|uniref:hypothetical protein n=1 Tax=Actinoplanes sp. NPDC023801 TaxID=3154595 RepID=UPI0033D5D7B1